MGAVFRESTADRRTSALPLSHVSLELGHFYHEDFEAGRDRLRAAFQRVRPWADALTGMTAASVPGNRPRISTCFLVDDYFTRFSSPAEIIPLLLSEAEACGLRIDYLARESGCALSDGVDLAGAVSARLVESPAQGSNGSRPPAREVGWLSNGARTPRAEVVEAMSPAAAWTPPSEADARRHSVFADVELWDEQGEIRTWSCSLLAAVWQLLRLGLLRHQGRPVLPPRAWNDAFPDHWDDLPPLVQLRATADPFAAYQTWSVLPTRLLPVEHAVRVVLGQFAAEPGVLAQVSARAEQEGLALPPDLADRVGYVFSPES